MTLPETQISQAPRPAAAMKFTYASGSRPLPGYTIKRGVGRGGFGEVYYALSDGGKEVALKLIRRNLDVELRGVAQCLNMKHPHLLGLFDIRKDDHDDAWVVMEYVNGECLEDLIARHPQGVPLPQALAWIHAIGSAVAYLHDKGVVHRDLKPGNIFSDENVVKVGDYGLSKFISASRRSGQTESVGTVHYMAPEVANGRYGKEIDIYALGIILYEMLTGRVPFDGESVGEVLMKHLTAEPDLSMLQEPYRTVVARALAKDPDQRFRSVHEFLAGLPRPPLATGVDAALPPPVSLDASPRSVSPPIPAGPSPAGPGPSPGPRTAAPPEEPVARAVGDLLRQARDYWRRANFSTATKIVLLVVAIIVAVEAGPILAPAALAAVVAYAAYRLVRALVLGGGPAAAAPAPLPPRANQPPPAPASPASAQAPRPASPFAAGQHGRGPHAVPPPGERPLAVLPVKAARQQFTELLGSLLLSSGVVLAVCVVVWLFLQERIAPNQFAWLVLVGTAGAWAVLLPSKYWEGREGEPLLRRFALLVLGLGLGAWAWLVHKWLLVDLPHLEGLRQPAWMPHWYDIDGAPLLPAFLALFGCLLPLLRWWKQADPLRATRLSLWSTAVVVCCSFLLSEAWGFPQPWGVTAFTAMTIAVQLASPWVDQRRRSWRAVA